MKAAVYEAYGTPEVLRIREVEKPAPKENELLVRVYATTVTIGDTIMRSLNIPVTGVQRIMARLYLGWRKPRRAVLGMELAGRVEAVGSKVTRFKPGDDVFGSTFALNFGGHAEYKCLPENGELALKPANLTFEEAAALTGGGMTALHCLDQAKIQAEQRVLVYGASGAVGTNAVQLASRHFGAVVTGVCSARNLDLVKSLGAAEAIDYTREDFSLPKETYDVVFDAVGKLDQAQAKRALKPGGMYLNVHSASGSANRVEILLRIKELAEVGKIRPVIDRVYPLEQIADAHRYVDAGHKRGNVAVRVYAGEDAASRDGDG